MVSNKAPLTIASEIDSFSIKDLAKLYPYEQKWRARQPELLQRGYQLRPRFRPGWKPSWRKWEWLPSFIKYGLMTPYGREDSIPLMASPPVKLESQLVAYYDKASGASCSWMLSVYLMAQSTS